MNFMPISFKGFKGRSKLLGEIKRYSMYEVMFFRTNVELHSRRVEWITEELSPFLVRDTKLDIDKLRILCRIHDDLEVITGDIQLGRKIYTMKKKELEVIEKEEEEARRMLAAVWPEEIHGYNYRELLSEARDKKTLEAQIMKLADRLDAFGESLHELYSGNTCFLQHFELPIGVNPVKLYTRIVRKTQENYPLIGHLMDGRHPLLSLPERINQREIVKKAKLPNSESIEQETGCPHYDAWKDITLKYGGKAGLKQLTNKIE
ncbi:HD domain-containing protein [Candidatus Pacearchaeota archaeon]|nr:HD domain-containing protein [Candidatus Pacearchaeota archaeon]